MARNYACFIYHWLCHAGLVGRMVPFRVESPLHRGLGKFPGYPGYWKEYRFQRWQENVCFPFCPLWMVSSLPWKDGSIRSTQRCYSEGLTLMQWKAVAETSRAHLTLNNQWVTAECDLEVSIQGLPPNHLSRGPQCPPSGSPRGSSTLGSTVNVEGLLTAWATPCLLWATWREKSNLLDKKQCAKVEIPSSFGWVS